MTVFTKPLHESGKFAYTFMNGFGAIADVLQYLASIRILAQILKIKYSQLRMAGLFVNAVHPTNIWILIVINEISETLVLLHKNWLSKQRVWRENTKVLYGAGCSSIFCDRNLRLVEMSRTQVGDEKKIARLVIRYCWDKFWQFCFFRIPGSCAHNAGRPCLLFCTLPDHSAQTRFWHLIIINF